VVLKSFSELSPEEKEKIAVIHITGKTDWKWVTDFYRQLDIHHQTFPFFEYMEKLYTQTDFAITRAGANTLFELALFRIPAVVIPYPFAGSHQKANAEFFAARGAVICKDESTVDEKWLLGEIRLFQKDLNQRRKMAEALAGLQTPQAAEELVEAAGRLLEGKA
jgi:UDP-N-acetylglucosamine--N-acetylmuramyl-(pentapeptide) pyrophosphoryl-undecaprenol N-acetylglucosamine transferase